MRYNDVFVNINISGNFFTHNRIEPIGSPVRIFLPFKDQNSADTMRRQLSDPGKKVDRVLQPVFKSRKISEDLKVTETNPSLVN